MGSTYLRRTKRTAFALLLAAPLAISLAGCDETREPVVTAEASAGPRLRLASIAVADWHDVSAHVATVDQAQVMARIPGILARLTVREGDRVAKGQAIGRIVDSQLGYQAGAYAAQAAAASAQAAQARSELARVKFLYDNGVYAKARLEQAQAVASAASAQIAAARAQQAAVGAVAGQGAVIAPASGRVLHADIPEGAPVAPGSVIAVITAGPAIVRLELPESLSGKVHPGTIVRASGLGPEAVTGHITKVYPSIATGMLAADVAMPGIEGQRVGRRVEARVQTGTRKALVIPARYIATHYGIDYVTVVSKGSGAMQVPVQTARNSDPERVEILSGVAAGDVLALPAADRTTAR